ncbi:MAG: peptide-methionine (S)-S-oxide reductase, partial [Planctomycetota bacterium]
MLLRRAIGGCLLGVALVFVAGCDGALEERASNTMSGTNNTTDSGGKAKMEKAMFGAGCFWGVEAAFRQVKGVVDTAAGYSGGTLEKPTY